MRLAVTALLLGLLATQIDWELAVRRVRDGDPVWLVAAIAAVFTGLVVGAVRWRALLRSAEVPATDTEVLRGYFIGAFANNFLPTGFGGDAVRALVVAPPGPTLARAASTVIVDRLTALACLLALGWMVLPFDPGAVPAELVAGLAVCTAAALAGAALLLLTVTSRRVRARVPARLRGVAGRDVVAAAHARRRPPADRAGHRPRPRISGADPALGVVRGTLDRARAAVHADRRGGPTGARAHARAGLDCGVRRPRGRVRGPARTAGVSATDATLLSLTTVVVMAVASLPGAVAIVAGGGRRAGYSDA